MKRYASFFSGIILFFVLSACATNETGTPNKDAGKRSDDTKASVEMLTAREAYDAMKDTIEQTLEGKNARLGYIRAEDVDASGRSKSWSFKYCTDHPEKEKYSMIYTFYWTKGEVVNGEEELFSYGLDTPDFEYLFNDIGGDWKDSTVVAEKAYKALEGKWGEDKESLSLILSWNSDHLTGSPSWYVTSHTSGAGPLVLDAKTGEIVQ